ncbi:Triosephosphate isomerase [Neochlamydia sp. AcF95]|nr:Triosephosphate isomerase [Neochlamydia sp. AcF95]
MACFLGRKNDNIAFKKRKFMTSASRPVVIAGNWKMYKTIEEAIAFIQELVSLLNTPQAQIYLAVPFTAIKATSEAAKDTVLVVGAQNINDASEGAFTGEIAGKMLKDAGAEFVIVGHSERRRLFHETDVLINKKVKRALQDNLQVIFCVGESKKEREAQQTHEVLARQLKEGLTDISAEQLKHIIIAYEPIWAIGMPQPAGVETAQEAQAFCRQLIKEGWGEKAAEQIIIQYGGAVKPENAKKFLEQPDVDGLLVGGASLSAKDFAQIINCYNSIYEEGMIK